jgi:hypothetical protein
MGSQAQPETPKERSHDSEHGEEQISLIPSHRIRRLQNLDTENQQHGTEKTCQTNLNTINAELRVRMQLGIRRCEDTRGMLEKEKKTS